MTRAKVRRVEALEAKARARAADRLPMSDVSGFLRAVLEVVGEEAGADVGARCAGRLIEEKEAQCYDLFCGMSAEQLEDVGRRIGLDLPDLSGMSAQDLARLYFGGVA